MKDTFRAFMREATRLTQAGRLKEATEAIRRALSGRPSAPVPPRAANIHEHAQRPADAATRTAPPHEPRAEPPVILDGYVFEVESPPEPAPTPEREREPTPEAPRAEAPIAPPAGPGEFIAGAYTHATLTRRYKLYLPPGHTGRQLALVVMLHGCTQDPDDFAAGTGMNERAREQGFFVLYPEQPADANAQRCWNWFKHNHQQRGSGEPALIAGMAQAVMAQYGIDASRVYIAGLSAGGAMASIVAAAYPDVFAALGVHSGLPAGAATNLPEALMAMGSGASRTWAPRAGVALPATLAVPTIVFHGDEDRTVHPRNGEQVIMQMLNRAADDPAVQADPTARVEHGETPRGRRFTRSTYDGDQGAALAEHWVVHGSGHAWSGGRAEGSYTDASGPDATGEMLRFFFEHPHRSAR